MKKALRILALTVAFITLFGCSQSTLPTATTESAEIEEAEEIYTLVSWIDQERKNKPTLEDLNKIEKKMTMHEVIVILGFPHKLMDGAIGYRYMWETQNGEQRSIRFQKSEEFPNVSTTLTYEEWSSKLYVEAIESIIWPKGDETTAPTIDTTTPSGNNTQIGQVEVIDGKHYLNVPVKSDSDTGNGDINSCIALPAPPEYYSYENIKNTVLTNSFTKEQLDALSTDSGKLQTVDFNKTDRINALSLIENHSAIFAGGFAIFGEAKDNQYILTVKEPFKTRAECRVMNSNKSYDQAYELFYRSLVRRGYEEIEKDGYTVKMVVVPGYSTQYYYEIIDGETTMHINVGYLAPENAVGAPYTCDAPFTVNMLVINEEENIMFTVFLNNFEKDPPFDWILQFAKIND